MRWVPILVAVGSFPTLGLAADLPSWPFEHVYASGEGCSAVDAAGGPELSGDYLLLLPEGLAGIEYRCDFLAIHPLRHGNGFVAVAECEEPGFSTPDLIAVRPFEAAADGGHASYTLSYTSRPMAEPEVYRRCSVTPSR